MFPNGWLTLVVYGHSLRMLLPVLRALISYMIFLIFSFSYFSFCLLLLPFSTDLRNLIYHTEIRAAHPLLYFFHNVTL